jgi:spermidine synthase
MAPRFEELDWQPTPLGELTLRRRTEPTTGVEVYEVKLGEDFLMSSLFTVAEEQLATLGLAVATGDALDVLVGGLGLGYTAVAALRDPRVRSLTVVDALPAVLDWHRRQLLPVSSALVTDERTEFVLDDLFGRMRQAPPQGSRRYDAILVDIDHSPRHLLDPGNADLYTADGLRSLARHLKPDGVFALWSDDPPDERFSKLLAAVWTHAAAHVVSFANPLTGGVSTNTVYVAW